MSKRKIDADVIVIGAGLSGLTAACTLHESGVKVLVLEARDRVGGKTWSRPLAGGIVDMGAAWINDTNQSRIYALAKKFGLELIVQNTAGDIVMHDLDGKSHTFGYGKTPEQKEAEPGGVRNMISVRDKFEELCHKIDIRNPLESGKKLDVDYDKMSMQDFVRHHGGKETALRTVSIWTRAMLGLEPREVSALFFLEYCKSGGGIMQMRSDQRDGGQFLRLAEGTQSISKCLAASLPKNTLHLKSPVIAIDDHGFGVSVTTSRQTFTAKRVILSIPTPLYKTIFFSPSLPEKKTRFVDGTIHGYITKVFLAYKSPWWRKHGLCGLTQSLVGLVGVTRDTSNDKAGHYSLLGFVSGDPGRAWSKLPPEERRKAVEDHFRNIFRGAVPEEDFEEPIDYIEQIWWNEEFSQGCPSPAMPPGLMGECGGELRTRVGNMHFVGTETAWEWRGYMDGAVRSGERGAREVMEVLGIASKL